jgi:hypothetical protein
MGKVKQCSNNNDNNNNNNNNNNLVQWSEFLAMDPEVQVRFPALPDFLRNSGSGTGFPQPREYN